MTPRQAQKIAITMQIFNVVIALITITGIIMLVVESVVTAPEIWQQEVPQRVVQTTTTSSMNKFRFFWQARILENKPRVVIKQQRKPVVKKVTPPPKVIIRPPLNFSIITTVNHSESDKAYAVLQDKRTRKQILVRQHDSLPNSKYKVAQIENDKVFFRYEDYVTHLVKEVKKKPQVTTTPRKAPQKGIEVIEGKLIVVDNLATSIANLRNGDQILQVDGKNMTNIDEFYQKIATTHFAKISVMRKGDIVFIYVIK